jgi:phage terminase large subunit-like protein
VAVYDIEVEGNHNFFANGILVHNCILLDDPNDRLDDDDTLTKTSTRWDKEIYDRVNDPRIDVRIVVQQRVAVNDLSGHVLENKSINWMVLCIPAHYNPERTRETPYGWKDWRTERGQVFHERYTEAYMAELREIYGPQLEAVCEQHPEKGDGDRFKMAWWRFWRLQTDKLLDPDLRPKECTRDDALVIAVDRHDGNWDVDRVLVTVDPTGASEKADASHVAVLGCVNKGTARLIVDDFSQGPRSYPDMLQDVETAIIKMANMTGIPNIHLLIEKTVLGPAVMATISERVRAATLRDAKGRQIAVTIEDYNPGKDKLSKESRGRALEVPISVGEVYVREGAQWQAAFFAEFKRFPKKPNDKVDAVAQYVDHYRQKKTWRDAMQAIRGQLSGAA